MDVLSEGATANICPYDPDPAYVVKRYKRAVTQREVAMDLERAIHTEVGSLLAGARLRVPKLLAAKELVMERIDVQKPLWEPDVWDDLKPAVQDDYIETLAHALNVLGVHGYQMKDVEVYVQPDDTLVMLDFGQVGKIERRAEIERRVETAAMVPPSIVSRLEMAWVALTL